MRYVLLVFANKDALRPVRRNPYRPFPAFGRGAGVVTVLRVVNTGALAGL